MISVPAHFPIPAGTSLPDHILTSIVQPHYVHIGDVIQRPHHLDLGFIRLLVHPIILQILVMLLLFLNVLYFQDLLELPQLLLRLLPESLAVWQYLHVLDAFVFLQPLGYFAALGLDVMHQVGVGVASFCFAQALHRRWVTWESLCMRVSTVGLPKQQLACISLKALYQSMDQPAAHNPSKGNIPLPLQLLLSWLDMGWCSDSLYPFFFFPHFCDINVFIINTNPTPKIIHTPIHTSAYPSSYLYYCLYAKFYYYANLCWFLLLGQVDVVYVFGILSNIHNKCIIFKMVTSTPRYITPLTPTLTLTIITLLLLISNTTSTPPPSPYNLTTNYPQEPPIYTLTKLSYSNLTKSQSTNLQHCALQHNRNYQLIPSINIHEGDSVSYPAIIRYCDQFYTINGYHLVSFAACAHPTCRYFVNSVRNQFTYFVQVESRQSESPNTTATIKRLQSRNKKVLIQTQTTIQIPKLYGSITSFANSFSLSLKLYAFATSKHYVLFYRADGTLQSCINLGSHHMPLFAYPQHMQPQPSYSEIKIVKLNNHLAIYTVELNKNSFIYTMSTNGKNSTLKKYTLPKVEPQQTDRIQIKFNDNHWNQFYLKVQNRVYVYDQTDKLNQILPKLWYPLLHHQDQFYIAGSMLIVVSHLGKHQHQHEPVRIYYNLTSNSVAQFFIPDVFCPQNTHIRTSSQGHTSQILCTFCKYSFQCYSLFSNADPNSISKTDYTDYSKFRVPLVLISLGVVIFISVTRGKKKDIKSLNEEKEQQMFMKELERKDKTLYEQLKKTRKVPAQSPANRNRGVQDTSQLE